LPHERISRRLLGMRIIPLSSLCTNEGPRIEIDLT
jgi:hypothetical protein